MSVQRTPTPYTYASAVAAGDFVFVGLHRGFGDDYVTQFDDAFRRLAETLAEYDSKLADLVKVHVWLKDIHDLPTMEKRFARYFEHDAYPARMTATTEFIDDDCLMMIDGTAYRGG